MSEVIDVVELDNAYKQALAKDPADAAPWIVVAEAKIEDEVTLSYMRQDGRFHPVPCEPALFGTRDDALEAVRRWRRRWVVRMALAMLDRLIASAKVPMGYRVYVSKTLDMGREAL